MTLKQSIFCLIKSYFDKNNHVNLFIKSMFCTIFEPYFQMKIFLYSKGQNQNLHLKQLAHDRTH